MIALFISKKSCEKSQEHQCSYDLLRRIIRDAYNCNNSELEIKRTKHNKPYIDKIPFSISHSCGVCCVAIDVKDKAPDIDGVNTIIITNDDCISVGVDIECISDKTAQKCRRVAQKKFFDSECEFLDKSESDNEYVKDFCRLWTQKESYCKFTGKGIVDALGFDTTVDVDTQFYQDVITIDGKKFALSVCYNSK